MVTLAELVVADPPEAWRAAGFTVDDDGVCLVGSVRIRLAGDVTGDDAGNDSGNDAGRGVVGWVLRGVPGDRADVDGVPTTVDATPTALTPAEAGEHANGATAIDHVVVLSPDLARTTAAFAALGVEVRRERDGELGGAPVRQLFLRLGEVILEVVGAPDAAGEGPATIWGITHTVADTDATAAYLGEHASPVKDAVQPGRRITTLRTRELGISVRTAFISPHVHS